MNIIFMGTPEFAIPSLKILLNSKYKLVCVVTSQDKPQGRGKKIIPSPVKKIALENNIPLLQPKNLQSKSFVEELKNYNADTQIIVAFRMLPKIIWAMPPLGTINLHASLLPAYRGAAPINWAIINGEKTTGVTSFFIEDKIDTGNIIKQDQVEILETDNAGTLHDRLMHTGAKLILNTIDDIANNKITVQSQKPTQIDLGKKAPKIYKENCQINWKQPAKTILNFIRGLAPYPGAWSIINSKTYKIFTAKLSNNIDIKLAPGETYSEAKKYLYIGTKDSTISIMEIQLEGRKKVNITDFLQGNKL